GPDGNLYVADLEPAIRVISPTGKPIRSWGKSGSGPGELDFGTGVAGIGVGKDGLVYVADSGNRRVQVFKSDGTFVRQFGTFGSGSGQFVGLSAVMVDGQGNVYADDDAQMTLTKFAPAGKPLWTIGGANASDP